VNIQNVPLFGQVHTEKAHQLIPNAAALSSWAVGIGLSLRTDPRSMMKGAA